MNVYKEIYSNLLKLNYAKSMPSELYHDLPYLAILEKNLPLFKKAIEIGFDLQGTYQESTYLMLACDSNSVEIIKYILHSKEINKEYVNKISVDENRLHYNIATLYCDIKIVKMLIELGAELRINKQVDLKDFEKLKEVNFESYCMPNDSTKLIDCIH